MAVTTPRWEELFAARTRADVGDGIAQVLGFLGVPGLISFAGGFPDPVTFPRERTSSLLAEFADSGEVAAFQYAPTRGLAGPLGAVADRIETLQGRRPAEDELLLTSGGMALTIASAATRTNGSSQTDGATSRRVSAK